MPQIIQAMPRCRVHLYKTISRVTTDGNTPASARYQGKDAFVDLTPFLGDQSSVRTSKSVRDPAGGFSITFTDQPRSPLGVPGFSLESMYGLIEPMDVVEIRMASGIGFTPLVPPIIMRGFVSDISRGQAMSADGKPMRTVTISGQDYGKIWQIYQILYLKAYVEGKPMLSSFALSELFGLDKVNSMPAGEFVKKMIEGVINPHIKRFLPDTLPDDIPKEIKTNSGILVKHGRVNINYQNHDGQSVYDILKKHGDVGPWNELYTEDREDGVHVVYRPIPALKLAVGENGERQKVHDDAPDPIYCPVSGESVEAISAARSDSTVANFYWVNNTRFDLIDDLTRRLYLLKESDDSVRTGEYPNSHVIYYGIRPLYAETNQAGDEVQNMNGGLRGKEHKDRGEKMETNQDNVVLERGTARIKGGPMRPDGQEAMKPGDYAMFRFGSLRWIAYVYQIEHEFIPYQGYTTTLTFDRGEGFVGRVENPGSPWLLEQTKGAV
jgi:hypothetical protein